MSRPEFVRVDNLEFDYKQIGIKAYIDALTRADVESIIECQECKHRTALFTCSERESPHFRREIEPCWSCIYGERKR